MSIFLAHSKQTPDEVIDDWTERASIYWRTPVVSGRDDYMSRSRALGGWNTWVKDVPIAEGWGGEPLFSALVVPLGDLERPSVGRATQTLIDGFIAAGKPVWAFCPETNDVRAVERVMDTELDSWTDAGWLIYQD